MAAGSRPQSARYWGLLLLLLLCYLALIVPFTRHQRSKPFVEKLGYFPRAELLQAGSADQKQLVGELLIFKVLLYYGGLVEKDLAKLPIPPDYPAMSRVLHGALRLDPYNMDGYYFAQSILVWDVGQVKVANELLEYGMRYRSWDWYLPFFAGFNYAYFLKDYPNAARNYQRAGELTGESLFNTLASRYLHEAGQTELALSYLSAMVRSATNEAIKQSYQTRLQALQGVRRIEQARDAFAKARGRLPQSLQELLRTGYLKALPVDPYGGKFYLEPGGKVATTSKFAFAHQRK